ncbi:MAG: hypothetical protein QXT74_01440 [Candidatus Nezhaarchaeales archaeon]
MEGRVRVGLALLAEAEAEGEDVRFAELIGAVARTAGELEELATELEDLLDLPPRVALSKLMRREEWGRAMMEASRRYVENKLRKL